MLSIRDINDEDAFMELGNNLGENLIAKRSNEMALHLLIHFCDELS